MPMGNPWPHLKKILNAESKIRNEKKLEIGKFKLNTYWADLARLLQIHQLCKQKKIEQINAIKSQLSDQIYDTYIEKRISNIQN